MALSIEQQRVIALAKARQRKSKQQNMPPSKLSPEAEEVERKRLLSDLAGEVGPMESAAIGIGRGLTDIARATGLVDKEDPETKAALGELAEQRPITQIGGRAIGHSLPFLAPGVGAGAIASTPLRIVAGAGVGGVEGAAIAEGTGEGNVVEAAGVGGVIGGVSEALFPVLSRLGGKLVEKVTGKTGGNVFDAAGNPTDMLKDALNKAGLTLDDLGEEAQQQLLRYPSDVLPEQAARGAQFEQVGLTPTRAQLTRDAADFQAQQEVAKTSGRVRSALETQEGLLANKFDEVIEGTGGQAVTSGSPVVDSVLNISTQLDNEISDLYGLAREVAPGAKNVKPTALGKKLRSSADSNTITGGLIQAVKGELKQRGIINDKFKVVGKIDVETAEEVRKVMNSFHKSTTDFGKIKLKELKNALDDDVMRAAGEDFFKQARDAKSVFENRLSRAKVSKFDSRNANLVRDVLENKISPDSFVDDVIKSKKWRASDLDELKKFSTDNGANLAPWNDLRAEVVDSIKDTAFQGAKDSKGYKALTRNNLEKALKKIGTEKLKVIFEPDELRFFKDMLNVSALREPVRGTAIGKGPSGQALQSLEKRVRDLPLAGAVIDAIDIDYLGRTVIKSNPNRQIKPRTTLQKVTPGAISAPGVAFAVEEDEN